MELTAILIAIIFAATTAQQLAFPASEEDKDGPGKTPSRLSESRFPIHIPGRCPPNQLLYPGNQKHDWVCDCGPGFIYYPPEDGCFKAYRKGPCKDKQLLVLPKGKVVPECVDNSCQKDGFVKFQEKCYELEKEGGPCKPAQQGGGIFGVNTTTLALECLQDLNPLALIIFPSNCPPGSRRGANSNCNQPY